MSADRRTARVLCVDQSNRVLLLRWRDPHAGTFLWEPPGGGIEPGETAHAAARRELSEETGLPSEGIGERSVPVARDSVWNGKRHVGQETFFFARFEDPPELSRDNLEAYETGWLDSHAWVGWAELGSLGDPVEPPGIVGILAELEPDGPWAG